MIAIIRSLADPSNCSPNRLLALVILLNRGRVMSRHRSHEEAAVCSLMNGVAILNNILVVRMNCTGY